MALRRKIDAGRKRYEKERRLKDGQEYHLGADPLLLGGIWLLWMMAMSFVWCWFVFGIRGSIIWLSNPDILNTLHAGYMPNFDPLAQGWNFNNFGNYKAIHVAPMLYWGGLAVLSLAPLSLVIRMRIRWRPNKRNQYGNDRLTTLREIQRQYPQIPDRQYEFPGYGGIPVAHTVPTGVLPYHPILFGRYYLIPWAKFQSRRIDKLKGLQVQPAVTGYYAIDQTTVNNLVIGISRSGKGETLMMPFVDIISRAQQKASMVLNDPKGELYQMSYKTLRKRGYNVQVLNIQDTDYSMSYNPLEKIIEYAKDGYYDEVQDAVNSLSSSIYVDPNAKDKFWQNSSINLLNSLILAVLDHAKRNHNWGEVTMDNVLHMMTDLGSKEVVVDANNNIIENPDEGNQNLVQKNKLLVYFAKMQELNRKNYSPLRQMALDAFAQSKFAGEETSGNIYSSAMEGIKIYQQSNIAKLTSLNSVDFESLGFPRRFRLRLPADRYRFKVLTISFMDGEKELEKRTLHVDKLGIVYCPIKTKLPDHFTIAISFDNYQNDESLRKEELVVQATKKYQRKGIGTGNYVRDKYTHKPILKMVKLVPTKNTLPTVPQMQLSYSEAPVALFLVTPPNNPSYNQLPAFAVDQIFNTLWKASSGVGRKVFTRVHFLLDEFGNMPTIKEMSQKVSIGLGAGLLFTLVVQNLEQLEVHYSKDQAATIQSNCQNLLYILTNSKATAEQISFQIGKRTVQVETVSGRVGKWNGANVNNNYITQDIISAKELTELMGGEMVVLRSVYRQDQKGNSVSAMPIFDHGKTMMPYRNTFLQEEFDDRTTIAEIGIEAPHRNFDLKEHRIDYDDAYSQLVNLMNEANEEAERQRLSGKPDLPNVNANNDSQQEALADSPGDDEPIFGSGDIEDYKDLLTPMTITLIRYLAQVDIKLDVDRDDVYNFWNTHDDWESIETLFKGNDQVYQKYRAAIESRLVAFETRKEGQ